MADDPPYGGWGKLRFDMMGEEPLSCEKGGSSRFGTGETLFVAVEREQESETMEDDP